MRVLTEKNMAFPMNRVPDEDSDIRFCVLDYSNPSNVDYFFIPMVFLESFNSAAADLQIGPYRLQMPWDWSIIIGDLEVGDLEVVKIEHCMERDFHAFSFNPLTSFKSNFLHIEITNVYPDVRWYFPKLKAGHILTIPLEDGPNPKCIYMVKETNKLPDSLDINTIM